MEGTVIIADDDLSIRTVLTQAVTRAGCRVKATGTLSTLWRWIEEGEGDALILDVILPDGDALDMLPALRKKRPEMPVIVVSANNTVLTTIRANQMGAPRRQEHDGMEQDRGRADLGYRVLGPPLEWN